MFATASMGLSCPTMLLDDPMSCWLPSTHSAAPVLPWPKLTGATARQERRATVPATLSSSLE
eukprot:1525299-Heterocapsa_arctica.AAC.1